MKKKILLFALPALLVLSSCANIPSVNNQLVFKEDTEAHSEIFGGEETPFELKQMNPRRTMTPGEGSLLKPKIGVQFRAPYTVGANDYIAIRFVAAIASLDTKVEWTRAAYDASGNMHGTKETIETTKAYSSLIDDGEPVAASPEPCF